MADASYPADLKYHPEHDWVRVEGDQAPFGIVGLETLLPLCIKTLIEPGHLTWPQLIEKLSANPARVLGIEQVGSCVLEIGERTGPGPAKESASRVRGARLDLRLRGREVAVPTPGGIRREGGRPLLERRDYVVAESETFLARVFQGEAAPLVAHFVKNRRLTPDDLKQLKAIIEDLEAKDDPE